MAEMGRSQMRLAYGPLLMLLSATLVSANQTEISHECTNCGTSPVVDDTSQLIENVLAAHPLWLRERCLETWYVHPTSKQPMYSLHQEQPDLTVVEAIPAEDDVVRVVFSDGKTCNISAKVLQNELLGAKAVIQSISHHQPAPYYWDHSLHSPSLYRHSDIADNTATHSLLSNLLTTGIALIEGVPIVEGECRRFGALLSSNRDTEWGENFNVRSSPDMQQSGVEKHDLAYTSDPIGMHTDNPYRDPCPDYQLLHALEHCSGEGCYVHNQFVDGFHEAKQLWETDPDAFELLSTVAVRWENNGGDDSSSHVRYAPYIELLSGSHTTKGFPAIRAINFSSKSGGYAPIMPNPKLAAFYEAKRMFSTMLHSAQNVIQVQLFPGALVIFNNRRVLHSRSQIHPSDGPRFLQGCYLNADGIQFNYEQLIRKFQARPETGLSSWANLKQATKADYEHMGKLYNQAVDQKSLEAFKALILAQKGPHARLGANIDLYEHGIQTASRAYRAGEDAETVVMSLLHDVFETTVAKNHGELASAMLAPWVSPQSQWILAHHEIFQGFYYYAHFGGNPNQRDLFVSSPYYNATRDWCEKYDQASFDPDYPSLPLSFFEPMLREVLSRRQYWWNPAHPKAGAVSVKLEDAKAVSSMQISVECKDTWNCYSQAAPLQAIV